MAQPELSIRFWGVRGSIPCPGPETVRYGGNTSCVEIRCGRHLMIFDGGSGLRPLGKALVGTGRPVDIDLFYTHTHFDHIVGLPFFAPAYSAGSRIRFWAGHLKPVGSDIKTVLQKMMSAPLFPIPIDVLEARLEFRDFNAGETLNPRNGVKLVTGPLNHPDGCTGYRIEFAGRSVAYITDTEHHAGQSDPQVLKLMKGADVAIYDCTYTDEEYPAHRHWGHSTWEEGVRLASEAKVKQFVIFHHDPSHNDEMMDEIAAGAAKMRPGTIVAHEGLLLQP
ncbi:MAG TPA: MBL fold metallo-hydrolase [Stellaceae bacterium]|nr:MBL fold metallo-hydrolase [Stellaceae bacterium]